MDAHNKNGQPVRIEQVISVGLIGGKSKMQEIAIREGERDILHVKGYATEHTTIESKDPDKKRPTTYIKGAFSGTNMLDGTEFISGQLILPDSASGYVCAYMTMNAGKPVRLDIVFKVQRSEKSVIGYKYLALLNQLSLDSDTRNADNGGVDTSTED